MAVVIRTIIRNWYPGATLYHSADTGTGILENLRARTVMTESPAGSGIFTLRVTDWDDDWVGRDVFDDGVLYESAEFAPPLNGGIGILTHESSTIHSGENT